MRKYRLKSAAARLLVFLSTGLISVLLFQAPTHRSDSTEQSPPIIPTIPSPAIPTPTAFDTEESIQLSDMFVDEDSLFHNGYEVRRLTKTAQYESRDDRGRPSIESMEVSYVVIKRNGRTVAEFDGVDHPLNNSADFGLFDVLGDKSEKLIVSLTVPRGGRHLVVSLQPKFRVLFDSFDFNVNREEFDAIDLDKDGVYELRLPLTTFYGLEGLNSVSETPLPEIYFKYDKKKQKYLPANDLFADYALRGLNLEPEKETYKHHRLHVLLDYVYAGKEKEGWVSFDTHYPSPDKEKMRSRIKARLKDDPVYQYIYQKRRR